jgi:hypothetical protein
VDIRADLYSLRCTFYYLLTGSVPFPGGSFAEKLLKHQMQYPTPIAQLRPEVPAAVIEIVNRLIAKRPEERFQTPAELAAVLSEGPAVQAAPTARLVSAAMLHPGAAPVAIPVGGYPPAANEVPASAPLGAAHRPDRGWLLVGALAMLLLLLLVGLFLGLALHFMFATIFGAGQLGNSNNSPDRSVLSQADTILLIRYPGSWGPDCGNGGIPHRSPSLTRLEAGALRGRRASGADGAPCRSFQEALHGQEVVCRQSGLRPERQRSPAHL